MDEMLNTWDYFITACSKDADGVSSTCSTSSSHAAGQLTSLPYSSHLILKNSAKQFGSHNHVLIQARQTALLSTEVHMEAISCIRPLQAATARVTYLPGLAVCEGNPTWTHGWKDTKLFHNGCSPS